LELGFEVKKSQFWRQKCRMGHTKPVSWFWDSKRVVNLVQFPSETGISPVEKKETYKISRQKCMMDHTLTSELVRIEIKIRQFGTFTK